MVGPAHFRFKIPEDIGQSGIGEVYRAEDTNLDREVTIRALAEPFTHDLLGAPHQDRMFPELQRDPIYEIDC